MNAENSAERRSGGVLEGWALTCSAAGVIVVTALAMARTSGASAEGIGAVIRLTARASLLLFCAAYSAAAMLQLFPSALTRWQRRNRRYLGVAFAASHGVHAAAITCLGLLHPETLERHVRSNNPIPGLVAYAFIVAMTATSFDRSARFVGARAWKLLHGVGGFYVWGAFMTAVLRRALREPGYLVPMALLAAVLAVRLVSWRQRRSKRSMSGGEPIGAQAR